MIEQLPPALVPVVVAVVASVVGALLWRLFKLALQVVLFVVFLIIVAGVVVSQKPELIGMASELVTDPPTSKPSPPLPRSSGGPRGP